MENLLIITLIITGLNTLAQEKKVLTLQECINIAIENNLSVQRSELSLKTAEVNLMQANAQRYPTLNANGSYGFNWGRSIDPNSNLFVSKRINTAAVGASGSLPLLQGLQVSNGIKQSKTDLLASDFDLQKAKNDISINVASFFLTVILNKELLETARLQLKSSKQQLDQTKKLVASGTLPISNKFQLESQVATNEVTLINNQNSLDLSLLDLKQALLLPPGVEVDVVIPETDGFFTEIEDINSYDIYESALSKQPEIKAVDARIRSANFALEVAKGSLYPSLSLNGNINTNYSDAVDQIFIFDGGDPANRLVPTDFETSDGTAIFERVEIPSGEVQDYGVIDQWDDNLRYSVSLGLFIPILNGFSNRAAMQQAKINVQQAELNARDERNILYQTIESAYRSALAASRTYSASEKQVAALRETYRALENQYNNGAANFTDYQVAANNLFQAQSDLSRARYDFIFRKKILDFYLR
ncbi:MAG: TolC family protein [Ekhidna sp.]|nr:TolC family protein [Ekhidna sp.]MBC6425174.1 TolC family protein [Ekhidna sp.]